MTKAVSNGYFCFIKAVLLWCEHGHFSLKTYFLSISKCSICEPNWQKQGLPRKPNYTSNNNLLYIVTKVHGIRVKGYSSTWLFEYMVIRVHGYSSIGYSSK